MFDFSCLVSDSLKSFIVLSSDSELVSDAPAISVLISCMLYSFDGLAMILFAVSFLSFRRVGVEELLDSKVFLC